MIPIRIAVATAGITTSVRDAIAFAAETRAKGVQFDVRSELEPGDFGDTARRQLLHSLEERDLRIASTTFPLRRPLYDAEHLDGRVAAIKDAMQFTSKLRCRRLTLRIGRIPDESQGEDFGRLIDALNDLARVGTREGVVIAIATVGDSADTLRSTLGRVTEGAILIDFDPVGCISTNLDPITTLKSLHDRVGHVQGRDAVRDLETGGHEVTLGRGETPWDETIAILADAHYDSWITARRTTGNDRRGDVMRAVEYLNRVAGLR